MWGNLKGWLFSAVIALGMGYLLFYVAAPPTPTPATNLPKFAVAKKDLTLPIGSDTVVAPGTKEGDAGDLYRKAIDDVLLTPSTYEKFTSGGQMTVRENEMAAVGFILSARDCRNCNLFNKDMTKVVNYENTEPPLDALNQAGTICCTLGKLYTNDKYNPTLQPEKAFALWEAAFVLGGHLYDERATFAEYQVGYSLMQQACTNLLDYYKEKNDTAKVEKTQAFADAQHDLSVKVTEAFQIVGSVDENYAGRYAGDVFEIAKTDSADKMFRAEALKHIGHYRFNAKTSGDQLAARRVLKNLMNDDKLPPNVKAAAIAAHDLTLEKHNMVGGAS